MSILKKPLLALQLLWLLPLTALANTEPDYTILTGKQARLVFDQCSRMSPSFRTGYRELDVSVVKKLEADLPAIFKVAATAQKSPDVKFENYKRQYVAYEILRRNLIYINGIHKSTLAKSSTTKSTAKKQADTATTGQNWHHQAINTCGGGHLYWGALFDMEHNKLVELIFNTTTKK